MAVRLVGATGTPTVIIGYDSQKSKRPSIKGLEDQAKSIRWGPRLTSRWLSVFAILSGAMMNAKQTGNVGPGHEDPARLVIPMVVEHILELSQRLLDADLENEQIWFRNLLLGVMNSARRDYRSVQVGVQKSPFLAAWGARNLLELRVIAKYIVKSEANAREFQADLVYDQTEFWTSVIKCAAAEHTELVKLMREVATSEGLIDKPLQDTATQEARRGAPIQGPRSEAAAIKQVMNERGLTRGRKPRPTIEMAKDTGLIDIYGPQSKMYSKLVHPTALSIGSSTIAGGLDSFMPIVETQAGSNLLAIYSSIETHIEAYGVVPQR